MNRHGRVALTLISLCGLAGLLQGCPVAVGTTAAVGTSIAVDRRTPGAYVDDGVIEFQSLNALSQNTEFWEQSHVNVTSFNGIVLITGETPSETLRQEASGIVRGVAAVREVHNELAVAAPSSLLTRSSDTLLTSRVKTSLLAREEISSVYFKVVSENGTVFLMGLVTRQEADIATEVARQSSGVQRVVKVFEYID